VKLTTIGNDPKQDIELIRDRANQVWAVEHDPQTGTHDFSETQTTVGAAGAATALPANPTGYFVIQVNGTEYVVPYYAKS
jgi:hypothetical protein